MFVNLKLKQRLGLGFGLLLLLMAVLAAIATWQLKVLAERSTEYAELIVPALEEQHALAGSLNEMRRFELRHVLSDDNKEKAELESSMDQARGNAVAAIDRYESGLVADESDTVHLKKARAALDAYVKGWDEVREVSRKTGEDPTMLEKAKSLLTERLPSFRAAQAEVSSWWDYNMKRSLAARDHADATYRQALAAMGVLGLVALIAGVAAAAVITRTILKQIGGDPHEVKAVVAEIAEGNLAVQVPVRSGDTDSVLAATRVMRDRLARIVGDVRASSENIATGSSQIATGNTDLSQRTEEQASNLQQTAASMEQLAGTVQNSAHTAHEANEFAQAAAQAALGGREAVGQVVATMQDISAASRRIADIIGTIDGIAFQTNILALNAAVEAARAGEQGRGFAVVAGEVRTLAQRSAEAAREIKSLIGASVEKVEAGARQVNEAGTSMAGIVAQVDRVTQMIGELSHAAAEQSTGIGQVNQAMEQLDQVTQQNAALVEESAAAAESLRDQAARLSQAVSMFRLTDEEPRRVERPVSGPLPATPPAAVRPSAPPSGPVSGPRAAVRSESQDWETF